MATEAEYRLALAGVLPDVIALSEYIFHGSVIAGDVITTDPEPGTLVPPDATITLLVSLGEFPESFSRWTGTQDPETARPLNELAAAGKDAMMVVFVHLAIPGDPVRVHTGVPTLKWDDDEDGDDEIWSGVGLLGGIDAISESLEVLAQPIKLSLSGVESSMISTMLNTLYHGSDVNIYVGMLDPDTYEFIDVPEVVWEGFIDVMWIDGNNDQTVIRVDCEHRLRRQPPTCRYTDEDQRSRYPNDRILSLLHLIPTYTGTWGHRDTSFAGGSMGGRNQGRGQVRPH